MKHLLSAALSLLAFASPGLASEADIVVYGGTSAGIAAAIQSSRMGKSVVVIEPGKYLGGLTTGGLGWTDSGDKAVIGGISREFYQRIKKHYDKPESWTHGKRDVYKFYRAQDDAIWAFEPSVATKIYDEMLKEHKIDVVRGERLDRTAKGIKKDGNRIVSMTTESGKTYTGKVFIDATYEGDLMARAGVGYHVGREPNSKYGETLNGVERAYNKHMHRFVKDVDPYVKPGDSKSGLLFGIETEPLPADGEGDHRLQAYCYRMCMSNDPANRVPFAKPEGYDEAKYELLFRNFEAGDLRLPLKPDMMPNHKTDTNNNCAVSTDYIGRNYKYPDASYAERDAILKDHETYQKGLMWALANHPRVPESIRTQMSKWGLPKDEFIDNGNWPHQIYVREARRMIGDYVHTELDCRRKRVTPDSVGMGSYNMDSHNCARFVTKDGKVQNEGDIQESPGGPYMISYKSIVPKEAECSNLLVPVCVSSSHISYGSIRMEPVFMILGQSAATAASLAIDGKTAVQQVPYETLKKKLLDDKQVLESSRPARPDRIEPKKLSGIVVDDEAAELVGFGSSSSANGPFVGTGYRHDANEKQGAQTARFTADIPEEGMYEVLVAYPPNANRATNVPVTVFHTEGSTMRSVNQRKPGTVDGAFATLGKFRLAKGKNVVEISNKDADGYVVIDAVRWVKQ